MLREPQKADAANLRDEYDDDGYDVALACTWCCGEGSFWGSELPGYDPGWHDPESLYPCPACHGTGDREDQVLF